jgi:hypothetical protein
MHLGKKTPDPMPFRIRRVPQSADQKADARRGGLSDSCRKARFKGSVAQSNRLATFFRMAKRGARLCGFQQVSNADSIK